MVFVPFTGIDNNKRCVTFGAGLLCNEEADSYVWLLECFLRAFKTQPKIVLSDQDSAMRIAIRQVFNKSIHRFFLWHITSKLQIKVMSNSLFCYQSLVSIIDIILLQLQTFHYFEIFIFLFYQFTWLCCCFVRL